MTAAGADFLIQNFHPFPPSVKIMEFSRNRIMFTETGYHQQTENNQYLNEFRRLIQP